LKRLDSRFHGNDKIVHISTFYETVNFLIQKILDKTVLDKHNLDIMSLEYFTGLADRFNLETTYLNYFGSFEPALPIRKPKVENPLHFIVRSFLWLSRHVRKIKMLDALNNPFFSSYILAIYKKSKIT